MNPLIPSCAPTVVMNISHIVLHIDYLGIKPLVDRVDYVNPLTDRIAGFGKIKRNDSVQLSALAFVKFLLAFIEVVKCL